MRKRAPRRGALKTPSLSPTFAIAIGYDIPDPGNGASDSGFGINFLHARQKISRDGIRWPQPGDFCGREKRNNSHLAAIHHSRQRPLDCLGLRQGAARDSE
jgi:hypothetical protein